MGMIIDQPAVRTSASWPPSSSPSGSSSPPPPRGGRPPCSRVRRHTPWPSRPTLRYGDTGSCVKVLQNLLLAKGSRSARRTPTGSFGPGTASGFVGTSSPGSTSPSTASSARHLEPPRQRRRHRLQRYRGPQHLVAGDPQLRRLPHEPDRLQGDRRGGPQPRHRAGARAHRQLHLGRPVQRQLRPPYGHWVINHSVSHPDYTTLSTSSIYYQLGSPGCRDLLRPPAVRRGQRAGAQRFATKSMRIWLWNVDTNDWRGKTRSQVVELRRHLRQARQHGAHAHAAGTASTPRRCRR